MLIEPESLAAAEIPSLAGTLKLDPKLDLPDFCVLCGKPAKKRQLVYSKPQNRVKRFAVGQFLRRVLDVGGTFTTMFLDEAFDERPLYFRFPVCEQHSNLNLSDIVCVTAIGNLKHARFAKVTNVHADFANSVSEFIAKRWEHLE